MDGRARILARSKVDTAVTVIGGHKDNSAICNV